MIHVLINTLAEKMNEFLSSYYERAEIIVEAGSIDATPNEDQSDKIILSIVNIERETAMGISAPYRNTKNNTFQQTSPPWYLNIYIMVAAVFSSKRYLESIQILSDSISFLQQNSILKLPDQGTITLEPVTESGSCDNYRNLSGTGIWAVIYSTQTPFPDWKDISIPYSDGKMRKSKFSFWKTYSCIHRRRLIIQSPPGNLP